MIVDTRYYLTKTDLLTHEEARSACQSLGGQWGLPDYQSYTNDLTDYMDRERLTSIWMALKKQSFGRWMWIDDTVC